MSPFHTHTCIRYLRTQNTGLKLVENPTTLLFAKFNPCGFRFKQEVSKLSVYYCSSPVYVVVIQWCYSVVKYLWLTNVSYNWILPFESVGFPDVCRLIIPEMFCDTISVNLNRPENSSLKSSTTQNIILLSTTLGFRCNVGRIRPLCQL